MTTLVLFMNILAWGGLSLGALNVMNESTNKRMEAACLILCAVSVVMAMANLGLLLGAVK